VATRVEQVVSCLVERSSPSELPCSCVCQGQSSDQHCTPSGWLGGFGIQSSVGSFRDRQQRIRHVGQCRAGKDFASKLYLTSTLSSHQSDFHVVIHSRLNCSVSAVDGKVCHANSASRIKEFTSRALAVESQILLTLNVSSAIVWVCNYCSISHVTADLKKQFAAIALPFYFSVANF
jgi:hypothetical protein